ncbi:SDR family oxidoreductase [Mycolicibacterium smegmatis]|uniref:Short chain dehydrogenase n=1 Tax=Mycolicibacterium smegmatis (strain MKD8) TaxID=1214915 RepID=A0A2U9PIL1_MYCSE|nr:SDR family oxidoreductase [Mycolicibacterium smegmatis]AWT51576.1 short chain dehydrogenase [Mycolicibacterium smegmatis MKD8]MCP2621382.1 SDR family oxidoreductase [Mycolicibacterium smegmatis]MCP2622862.1 SDR family oxidoreductase [Mycolicibacterium smegmatis]MDF1898053.1 SDR family oxidoreductase [Mycolicibacterium smegmatis]MDF1904920.1 SDR family oxidoreductase [Mycolicibacterium smegmatis]
MQQDTTARVALITGASRGIGAEVAHRLAASGTHSIVNYRANAERAEGIAETIRAAGGQASTIRADIADEASTAAMIDDIGRRFGRLDALVLTALGGPRVGLDPRHAMRLNRDAQRRLARLALPLMPAGGHIVFVTSHQAHFFPHKAVPKGYGPIAASKRAGETALYAMRPEFDRHGVHFTVVSGAMLDEMTIADLWQRREPEAEFASAVVHAATAPKPSGIVFVGRAEYLMTA